MSGCPMFSMNTFAESAQESPRSKEVEMDASILGFVTTETAFIHSMRHEPTHYSSYLNVETLTRLQEGEASCKPEGKGLMHHEELTFIIVHQVFELWFKLIISDLVKCRDLLKTLSKADKSQFLYILQESIQFINRAETIFTHAIGAFAIMETMHPGDFLEFRDFLVPASGFQSVSFRSLEQLLGLPNDTRALVNNASVLSYLQGFEKDKLKKELEEPSLNELIIDILCEVKVPTEFNEIYLQATRKVMEEQQYDIAKASRGDKKAESLINAGVQAMQSMLDDPVAWSEGLVLENESAKEKYRKAVHGALFTMSYRKEAEHAYLAKLLDAIVALEQSMISWRGRHAQMAERMIGRRGGTGGTSSGVGYLNLTQRYRIFNAIWIVRKMLIRRSALPDLSAYTK